MFQFEAVLIATEMQVVNCHKYFAQVQVFFAELLVASFDLGLDFILFLCSIFYSPRKLFRFVTDGKNCMVQLFFFV